MESIGHWNLLLGFFLNTSSRFLRKRIGFLSAWFLNTISWCLHRGFVSLQVGSYNQQVGAYMWDWCLSELVLTSCRFMFPIFLCIQIFYVYI